MTPTTIIRFAHDVKSSIIRGQPHNQRRIRRWEKELTKKQPRAHKSVYFRAIPLQRVRVVRALVRHFDVVESMTTSTVQTNHEPVHIDEGPALTVERRPPALLSARLTSTASTNLAATSWPQQRSSESEDGEGLLTMTRHDTTWQETRRRVRPYRTPDSRSSCSCSCRSPGCRCCWDSKTIPVYRRSAASWPSGTSRPA